MYCVVNLIVYLTKSLNSDWSVRVKLIPNCTSYVGMGTIVWEKIANSRSCPPMKPRFNENNDKQHKEVHIVKRGSMFGVS